MHNKIVLALISVFISPVSLFLCWNGEENEELKQTYKKHFIINLVLYLIQWPLWIIMLGGIGWLASVIHALWFIFKILPPTPEDDLPA